MFPGETHCRELLRYVLNRDGSLGMLDQRVIALPIPVRLLMKLHLDLYAFVYRLNHRRVAEKGRTRSLTVTARKLVFVCSELQIARL